MCSWLKTKFQNLVNLDEDDEANLDKNVEYQDNNMDIEELKTAWQKTNEFFEGHQTIISEYDMNLACAIEQTFKKASNNMGVG